LLKKSTSNLTASSYSLIGSEMLNSGMSGRTRSTEASGVLVPGNVRRGWDWRKRFKKNAQGEDVLGMLRMGLAAEIGRAWLEEGL
ncbi:hypothetical protein LTS18_010129, partial [Coniosporium uncinatum]